MLHETNINYLLCYTIMFIRPYVSQVIDIKTHHNYSFPEPNHDLAIMTLNSPVTWSPQVAPVCLPASRDNFATMRAALAGWG